ncbi:MAG: dUTP diphosphatase [Candidatus Diapherotrites archaeon]
MIVKVKRLSQEAKMPKQEHHDDSGFDIYSAEEVIIKPFERKLVSTGISLEIPKGYEGQIRPKSGLAIKHGISMVNTPGTIDAGYRGEIKVILINLGNEEYKVEKGKKIAQIVFAKVEQPKLIESELKETKRGSKGFGSTGLS